MAIIRRQVMHGESVVMIIITISGKVCYRVERASDHYLLLDTKPFRTWGEPNQLYAHVYISLADSEEAAKREFEALGLKVVGTDLPRTYTQKPALF